VPVLHCTDDSQQTVEKGHSLPKSPRSFRSALPPIADIPLRCRNRRVVPRGDILGGSEFLFWPVLNGSLW
jgi:hypothetical protein